MDSFNEIDNPIVYFDRLDKRIKEVVKKYFHVGHNIPYFKRAKADIVLFEVLSAFLHEALRNIKGQPYTIIGVSVYSGVFDELFNFISKASLAIKKRGVQDSIIDDILIRMAEGLIESAIVSGEISTSLYEKNKRALVNLASTFRSQIDLFNSRGGMDLLTVIRKKAKNINNIYAYELATRVTEEVSAGNIDLQKLDFVWREWDQPPFGMGHGVEFHDSQRKPPDSLVAFVDGFEWLLENCTNVEVYCIKPDEITSYRTINFMRRKIEELVIEKEIPFGKINSRLTAQPNC